MLTEISLSEIRILTEMCLYQSKEKADGIRWDVISFLEVINYAFCN